MIAIIPAIIILPLVAFYLWMFWDMVNNPDLPEASAGLFNWPPKSRSDWVLVFIILNVFGSVVYYFYEYKK